MHYAFTIFYVSPATEIYHFTGNRSATDQQVEVLGLHVCVYQFKCSTIVGALSNKLYKRLVGNVRVSDLRVILCVDVEVKVGVIPFCCVLRV